MMINVQVPVKRIQTQRKKHKMAVFVKQIKERTV